MLARGDFVLFSVEHSAALLILALLTAILSAGLRWRSLRPSGPAFRRAVCLGIASVIVAGTVFEQVYKLAAGQWSPQHSLPLHLCDIAVFVTAAALLLSMEGAHTAGTENRRTVRYRHPVQTLYELAYYWGLAATTQALLTPDVDEPFPHPLWLRYFVTHGGIVMGVFVMTIGLRMRPRAESLKWVWLLTLGVAVAVFAANGLIGSNYMFLCQPPENVTIIDYLGPWPWYLLSLVVVGTGLVLLCYSPWWLLDRRRAARR